MNDGESLLRNILINPADDMARLIYADWLEDNGNARRSEFIRLQVELAKWEAYPGEPFPRVDTPDGKRLEWRPNGIDLAALRRREEDLFRQDEETHEWFGDALSLTVAGTLWLDCLRRLFNRGFISAISCTAAEFVKHARTLFSQHPIERVKLTDRIKMYLHATDSQREFVMRHRVGRWDFCIGPTEVICVDNGTFDYSMASTLLTDLFADAVAEACVAYGREQAGLPRLNFLPADPPWKLRTISNPILT